MSFLFCFPIKFSYCSTFPPGFSTCCLPHKPTFSAFPPPFHPHPSWWRGSRQRFAAAQVVLLLVFKKWFSFIFTLCYENNTENVFRIMPGVCAAKARLHRRPCLACGRRRNLCRRGRESGGTEAPNIFTSANYLSEVGVIIFFAASV